MAKRQQRPVKNTPQLDIVIPVYGQAALLKKCLDALPEAAQGINYHVILVDDLGPEQEQLTEVYRGLNGPSTLRQAQDETGPSRASGGSSGCNNSRLLKNKHNSGFARSVNYGVSVGRAPFILILNSDVILYPGAIPAMLKEFDIEEVGIVGCKLIFADQRWGKEGQVQHAGIVRNPAGHLIHVNLGWSADHPKVNQRREMQMVTGACLMTRRKAWQQVTAEYRKYGDPTSGALNEVYDKGCFEDVEFCLAARAQGYKVIYTPDAVGLHYVGASVTGAKEAFPLSRNALIFGARCGHLVFYDEYLYL